MCTAISYRKNGTYFGRNLDLEYSYHEEVTVVPRNFPLSFRLLPTLEKHYAMIGMAFVQENYPLFYDAVNEKGLGMSGLNFPDHARYKAPCPRCDNVASFEFIPHVLARCADLKEARALLERVNLADISFSEKFPPTPLHFLIADRTGALVVEPTEDGLKIYDNPVGVLTNNPPFDIQLYRLSDYMALSPAQPENTFSAALPLHRYSRGMGAFGLPGDWSSPSRFVRAAFVKENSVSDERGAVSQFFHMLDSVKMPRGAVLMPDGRYEITVYSSCCDAEKGIYYYTTYENRRICAVDMHREDLEGKDLARYPIAGEEEIAFKN